MKRSSLLISAALLAMPVSVASAQRVDPAPVNKVGQGGGPPAPYTAVRWNEDYSYLKDPARKNDLFDPVKYIPFNASGSIYLSLGGQFRERYENFGTNNNFGAGIQDDDGYFLHRGLVHADLHLGPVFRVFGQVKSALEDGREGGPRASDADEFDVQQLFADARIPLEGKDSVTLRFGRQDLLYGAQRLISPLDWTNVRRTFQGGKVSAVLGNQTIDAFVVRPVIVDVEEPNDGDPHQTFGGVYDSISVPDLIAKGDNTKIEAYVLGLFAGQRPAISTFGSINADADTYTVGVRFSTNPKPFDLDVEADYQFGQAGSGQIKAYSLAIDAGYTFADVPLMPRAFLGFDIASGDDDPTDGDLMRFNQLFPLGHAYFGYIDVIGRQNIIDLHPGVELALLADKPFAKKVTARAEYHLFWRQSDNDAVFNAAGGVLRAAGATDETFVGSEIDLLVNWQIDRHTAAYVGYSHFFAGDFLSATGADDDIDFFYAAVTFTF
jgi:hypothetical protein